NELFAAVFNTPLEQALVELTNTRDGYVQAVHLSRNYAFPWTTLYDFALPPRVAGGETPTVCKGFQRKKKDDKTIFSCAECLNDCWYPNKSQAVCVYGFWGIRHQVEQIISDKIEKPKNLQPIGQGAIAFTMGISGEFVDEIPKDLTK